MPTVAVEAVPTKSQIQAWPTDHLDNSAAQWDADAEHSSEVFAVHVADIQAPGGTTWNGAAADAAYNTARDAQDVVTSQCAIYRECAAIARRGADDIRGAQRAAMDAIADAEDNGFTVGENLSVTDTRSLPALSDEYIARRVEAQHHSEYIRWRAGGLVDTEARVARELTAKAAELDGVRIIKSAGDGSPHMLGSGGQNDSPISEGRRHAIDYADTWARGKNPAYADFGDGYDCTNFVSQALRAGGFEDVHRSLWPVGGNSDEWFYEGPEPKWLHPQSTTWALARESHNYWTQHSGLGSIVGVVKTPPLTVGSNENVGLPDKARLDPLAPSKAGLKPGDLIYYKESNGDISHVAMYVGQEMRNGVLTDIVDQHADGKRNFRDDWMPDSKDYAGGQAEFVHVRYPGE